MLPAVRRAVEEIEESGLADRVSEAGSVRRRAETSRDLDLIATAEDPAALTAFFAERPWVAEVVAKGSTKATVVSHDGHRFDLRVVPPESYGNLLQHFTGSKDHNVALREDAVRRGMSISEYGVKASRPTRPTRPSTPPTRRSSTSTSAMRGFRPSYARTGVSWRRPGSGGLQSSPLADLKGDLHMHTDWSDGRGRSRTWCSRRRSAVGSTSPSATTPDDCATVTERQTEEIAAMNERVSGITVLAGIEVDIRDGSLDYDDEASRDDWVMVDPLGVRPAPRAPHRPPCRSHGEPPHVDCIGHPTGRKINRRPPYELDLERIFEKAVETGTFLEINAQPDRLDLTDNHSRAAAEAGASIVVSTDAHRIHELDNPELGVAQARRGWVTAGQVVNTRTWAQVKKLLKT